MKKESVLLSVRNPYLWALVFSLILIILVASFTTVPADEFQINPVINNTDTPSYCSELSGLNVVNKYGRNISISSNTAIYRVAGDRMQLSVDGLTEDSEVMPSLYLLSTNKSAVLYPFGNFSANGYYSFWATGGTYAVGMTLTQDQFDACGGNGAFEKTIEYGENIFVVNYYLIINVIQPTPQPRDIVTPLPSAT